MFKVQLSEIDPWTNEPDGDFWMWLIIEDDTGRREYHDHGEPEDNSFGRDYGWVQRELQKAYEQGRKDGVYLGLPGVV